MTDAATSSNVVSTSSWTMGVTFSVVAALITACAKLCIRKSYMLLQDHKGTQDIAHCEPPSRTRLNAPKYPLKYCDTPETLSSDEEEASEDLYHDTVDECDMHETFTSDDNNESTTHKSRYILLAYALRALGLLGETVIGPILNTAALQFASPSLLSPIGGGLSLVLIFALSSSTINEAPRQAQLWALPLLLVGQILVAVGGDHTNVYAISMENLNKAYQRPEVIIFGLVVLGKLVALILAIRMGTPEWRRFSWGVLGGTIMGSQCFVKEALAVMHGLDSGDVWPPELVGLWILAGILPFAGLMLMMECMKRYDATYTASMFTGSIVVSSSVWSAVRYGTFGNLPSIGTYLIGLIGILVGTALLATENGAHEDRPPLCVPTGGEGSLYGAIG